MSLGFLELVALMMSLGDFGVAANPNAASSAEVMKYAVTAADYTVHVDVEAILPSNYKVLTKLPNKEPIRSDKHTKRELQNAIKELEAGRALINAATGMDIVNDVTSASAWITLSATGEPAFLVALRGKIPSDAVKKVAALMGGNIQNIDGQNAITDPSGMVMAGVTADGVMLLGKPAWVKDRLSSKWKAPGKGKAGSSSARVAALIDEKPFMMIASHPSKTASARLAADLAEQPFIADFAAAHAFAAVAMAHNGIGWTWTDRNKAGYATAVMASEGLIDIFRAMHFGARGLSKFLFAALESYRGTNKEIDAVLKNKKKILALVTSSTGDGQFKAKVTKQPKRLTVTVKATGTSFSDVIPLAAFAPAVGAGAYLALASGGDEMVGASSKSAKADKKGKRTKRGKKGRLDAGKTYRAVKNKKKVRAN